MGKKLIDELVNKTETMNQYEKYRFKQELKRRIPPMLHNAAQAAVKYSKDEEAKDNEDEWKHKNS